MRNTDQYLSLDDVRIRFRDEGSGPVVVMVHGWTLDLQMWDPQVAGMRDSFRIIRLDRRGFGLSSGRPSPMDDISDIARLCKYLELRRVALVGMSQGVRAALGFAAIASPMISCLILDGPPEIGRKAPAGEDDIPIDYYRTLIRTDGIDAFRREWTAHPLVALSTKDLGVRALLQGMISRYPGKDLADPAPNAEPRSIAEPIDSLHVPMLLITGEYETEQRTQAANDLAAGSPEAVRAVIRGAGHLSNLDNPSEYNAILSAFLRRHASPLF